MLYFFSFSYKQFAWLLCFIVLFFIIKSGYGQNYTVGRHALGKLRDGKLQELSGLKQSILHSNMFWVHNDSGDSSRIFLIDNEAQLKGEYMLAGVDAKDVEDIAIFQHDGKSFVVLADIGDNRAVRSEIMLYVFAEPEWNAGQSAYTIPRQAIRTIRLKYADKPRDAEAIFVDPIDGRGYLIAKRDFHVGVYPVDLHAKKVDEAQLLKQLVQLPLTFITAADISADGRFLLLKNLTGVFLWERQNDESMRQLFTRAYIQLPYAPEPQGEAICFGTENSIFYTISERPFGLDSYLYRYNINPIN